MTTQQEKKYTVEDLSLWYEDKDGLGIELKSFSLNNSSSNSEIVETAFPQDFSEYDRIKYNSVTVSEEECIRTQRYTVKYVEYIRNGADKPVIEKVKKIEYYPMQQYTLKMIIQEQEEKNV